MRMRNKPWVRPVLEGCEYYYDDPLRPVGNWQRCFPEKQALHLELGCGKGVFIAKLAAQNPDINYLAIDMKSVVLASAVKNIEQEFTERGITKRNVVLTAYDIERILNIMEDGDIAERIYINFCNPWPKPKHHKRRLVYTRQLLHYRTFLADKGEIHFKTDDAALFEDSLVYFSQAGFDIIYITRDLYASDHEGNISTEHEQKFHAEGVPIKFLIAVKRRLEQY